MPGSSICAPSSLWMRSWCSPPPRSAARSSPCEEHNIIGGLGEAVCSLPGEKCPVPVKRIGVNDEFGHSGPAADLLKQFGLSAEHITEVTEAFVK